jgi:CRP/FNR family cyclic AMP-dependent transcriptional regulator
VAATGYERALVLEALSYLETFKGCDKRDMGLLADAVSGRHSLADGETLCVEGDAAESWWVILGGSADVTSGGTHVGSIGKNDAVGELALFDDEPRSATVTAVGGLDVLSFDKSTFIGAVLAAPQLGVNLLRSAAGRLRATNKLI